MLALPSYSNAAETKANLTLQDIMRFEQITEQTLSPNGQVLAYAVKPDRGDSRGVVKLVGRSTSYDVAGGSKPALSNDGAYAAFLVKPSLLDTEKASKAERKKLKDNLTLVNNQTGEQQHFERVKSFAFSENGQYLLVWHDADEPKKEDKAAGKTAEAESNSAEKAAAKPKTDKADLGSSLEVVNLANKQQQRFSDITEWQWSYDSRYLALAQNNTDAELHKLLLIRLDSFNQAELVNSTTQQIGALALSRDSHYLAYTAGDAASKIDERLYQLSLYDMQAGKFQRIQDGEADKNGWRLNRYASLSFSADGERLFFGRVPELSAQFTLPKVKQAADLYDETLITEQRGLNIWHGDDQLIKPNEINHYKTEVKRTYLAVLHLKSGSVVQLADKQVPDVNISHQRRFLLASSDVPYQKMITWAGFYRDWYLVDLNTGHRQPIIVQQSDANKPTLSPNGGYVAYYQQGNIYLYDVAKQHKIQLNAEIKTPFADEDHDYPSPPPGYGFGPWLADDDAVLVYDKYDIWQFDTRTHQGFMLTAGEGRKQGVSFRVEALAQPDNAFESTIADKQSLLLQGYSERTKADGFYNAKVGTAGVKPLLNKEVKLTVLARASNSEQILFSQQRYDLFPDLFTAKVNQPQQALQQTDLDKQRRALPWGKAELVHWLDGDGRNMDGVVIKPANYKPGKKYPVMVYYYRFMSQRLHAFPDMKINHRPNFAWYAADDYVIFLPDIRFEVGYPGISSVKALTSAVQSLIASGIAEPNAIGLQGHSWSGYQTAFAVTQTNLFKAAVAGAPVSNMTSAFSGIRLGSGLARQFQYETGQSRIGESLLAAPQKYIENSPVFYVDRVQTPLLIMFGDRDDAVPYEQGIELYLAMRRAGKDVIMLQYEDEPHHLKKYPNKLDYTIRMKQYFDHYLKGKPAATWMTQGEAYREPAKAD
ncbi:prolyl oligopeptidase family serine peptidase [Shewanella avicenniae]|uniref:Prolyl oligopeptidase family serine peptidase n=1 Tax=Shewanella avicenniae TaxID=2814294 RepID=A0ABX7QV91_9GAMM|nr:prolyl oligopeptidase family serine peptidase [Shewanella avicenniae]QSX35418.1 prolyl oligopeptidase family serine peptidase [Shewanella avicenniae]